MIKYLLAIVLICAGCASKPDDIVIKNTKGETVYTGTITHHPDVVRDYLIPAVGAGSGFIH